MNKKFAYGITAAVAFSATAFAAESVKEVPASVSAVSAEELQNTPSSAAILERLTALENQAGLAKESGWAGKVRVKGDFRYRFQHVQAEDKTGQNLSTTKNIQRIRARLGAYAQVNDFTEAAIGIRTGDSANSGNVTLGDGFDGKTITLSLAYLKFTPEESKYGEATMGKMKQTWKNTTDLIWDGDVNPEGLAYAYKGKVKDTGLIGSAGYFKVIDNKSETDTDLAQLQGGVVQPIGDNIKVTLGASMYYYKDVSTNNIAPASDVAFRIGEGFAELGFKDVGPIPFKLYGNYVNNTAEEDQNQGWCAGIKFGDAKKGKWEAKYDYRNLELFAAPAAFTESDFADGGTGVKGHRIKAKYNFAKNLQGGIAYIYAERTPERTTTAYSQQFNSLFLDLMVKF